MQRKTMTVQEIADYLGVSRDTIYKMVQKKEIPHIRIRTRILFYQETIDSWMIKQQTMHPVETG
ncbi:helix-turn-helix domain-containing protein [Evansella tamaricis]|uniref:Helix-turn-helix domain-containing protein n=1 Tax=Evansella tamaricis TaxID=2069301 RepID=A0ABS6JBS1_9BACI|nr:helix-turn-helix domain-containing protein [Evansella tamaricis]MBU9711111.1 helix-turn-helix domain-containing protein [Evansella tamaricis]